MKILQLCNKMPYPAKDGGAIASLSLSQGFADAGHCVTILAMNTSKHYFDVNKIPKELTDKIKFISVDIDTKIKPLHLILNLLFSKLPYNAKRFYSKQYLIKLTKLLKEENFDIVQLEGLYLSFYIPIIRKYSNATISFRAHNIEHEIWERTVQQQKNIVKKYYFKILAKRIKTFEFSQLNKYDLLIPITKRDENIFNKLGNIKPSLTCPTGINYKKMSFENHNIEFPSLFHIGSLDWIPNTEGLLWFINNVWFKIKNKYPEINFYIAGRNAPDWFINKIKDSKIEFLGEIEDAYKFMNTKAIMIVPLLSGSGMRIKIIEGMALGKTIVTTSIGIEGIDANHKKNILIANSTKEFIDTIEELINNKDFFIEIGINAKEFIKKHFDNFAISKSLLEFYKIQSIKKT
ncbi:MAG: glycosyltransferase family 4 protein [Bacteroidales bacterium]|nr:glycosyltransferase family 4 protein [Bacteroidales bacterium]